jgi:hypothetical protein
MARKEKKIKDKKYPKWGGFTKKLINWDGNST